MVTYRKSKATARAGRATLICASLLAAACSSGGGGGSGPGPLAKEGPTVGQSGSEGVPPGGGDTVPCPCGLAEGLRVTVLARDGDRFSLRVEEVLGGSSPVGPGDVIDASQYDDTFACYRGCFSPAVGDQALALYAPGEPALPACAARDACVAACDAENLANEAEVYRSRCACRTDPALANRSSAWESPTCGVPVVDGGRNCRKECEQETAETCPRRPVQDFKRGVVALSPWADPIVFARTSRGELSVPLAELGELFELSRDLPACTERFGDWSQYIEGGGY